MAITFRAAACAAILGLLALGGAQQARAADEQPAVVWHCWYESSGIYRIRCLAPASAGSPAAAGDERWRAEELRQELLVSGEAEEATRLVRSMPASFSGTSIDIPIYAPPYRGVEFSERLAKAVMCGRQPACRIAFDPGPSPGDGTAFNSRAARSKPLP